MGLQSLSLQDFRCFDAISLEFAPGFNLVTGENASGKTSLLESIFLLGRGRSFRTANLDVATQNGRKGFQISGKVTSSSTTLQLRLIRTPGQLKAKIGNELATTLAQLSETFPVQLVDSQSHLLIRGGPQRRRQFLDWGVFHVEPAFFPVWRRFQRALQQRNRLLRASKSAREIKSWDNELVAQGEHLSHLRQDYLSQLIPTATRWAGQALGATEVDLRYRLGWPQDDDLRGALHRSLERDRQVGSTQIGPHRADLQIFVEGQVAQERVSRGQEKVLVGALLLAQAAVYRTLMGKPCTVLLDDLEAELDQEHLDRFLDRIEETGAQTHVTAIDPPEILIRRAARVFHVEQGEIRSMV